MFHINTPLLTKTVSNVAIFHPFKMENGNTDISMFEKVWGFFCQIVGCIFKKPQLFLEA